MRAMTTAVKTKDAILDGFDWLVDSKFGLVFLTALTIAFVAFVLPAIATTIVDATAEGYTGKATIQEHQVEGSFCTVHVLKGDGTEEKLVAGPRAMCGNVEDGSALNMKNGNIKN